jgi:hypothetical protein
MATKKVKVPSSWNAKPVTKVGGGSGGVRDPKKPYADKPKNTKAEHPARWDAKTKIERLKEAAKTKPKSPAPRGTATPKPTAKPTTKPNSKTLASRGKAGISMPNSSRAGINLPRAAVNALPKPIGPTTKGMTPTSVATGAAKATVKGVASRALMLPAIAAQIADIKGGFETLANHPFLKGKGTPSGAGSSRGAAPVAGGGSKPKKPARPASDYEKLFQTGGGRANYGLDKAPVAPLPASVRKLNSSSSGSSTPSRGSSTKSRSSSSSPSASTTSTLWHSR